MAAVGKHSTPIETERNRLSGYSGSEAHKTLQAKISDIASGMLPECMNLVMKTCNVLNPVSFSKAAIVLQPYVDLINKPSTSLNESDSVPVLLFYDQIFDTRVLDVIRKQDLDSTDFDDDTIVNILLVILDFIHGIEKHQDAIYKIKNSKSDETSLTAVLACHLFSQLTPSHKYVIDDRCKSLGSSCPCECKAKIQKGCTAIGSCKTWHGYADIMLNNIVAVSILEQTETEEDSEDDDNEDEQPPVKKICKREDKSFQMCVEVKNVKSNSKILSHMQTVNQIIAESITNGFAQVNMNPSLSGCLIPTFGCTAEAVCMYLYDSDNDILLQTCCPLELWESDNILSIRTIVKIWLVLNFPVFFTKNISTKYDLAKSNFHTCAESSLKNYSKIQCNKSISYSDCYYDKLYEPVVGAGRRARLKNESESTSGVK